MKVYGFSVFNRKLTPHCKSHSVGEFRVSAIEKTPSLIEMVPDFLRKFSVPSFMEF